MVDLFICCCIVAIITIAIMAAISVTWYKILVTSEKKVSLMDKAMDTINDVHDAIDDEIEFNHLMKMPEMTNGYLNFVREFTTDHTYLAFEQFIRINDFNKLNRQILEKFMSETAKEINTHLMLDEDNDESPYNSLLVDRDYIQSLIISTVIRATTALIEARANEEGGADIQIPL